MSAVPTIAPTCPTGHTVHVRCELCAPACDTCADQAAAVEARAAHGVGSPEHLVAIAAAMSHRTPDGRTVHSARCPEAVQFSLVFGVPVVLR